MAYYLAVDLGTTGCRCILFNEGLHQLAMSYREYPLITLQEGWVEQDANLWWELTKQTAKEAISNSGVSGKDVCGISISSQGITVVPVDEEFQPLCNAFSWLDVRAVEECKQIDADYGQDYIFTHTGKPINACYSLPKILWLQNHNREIYDKAWKLLMPMDFLTAKFTGECVTDHSMASGTLIYDIHNLCWSIEILNHYGICEDKLPKLAWSGQKVGFVLPDVAEELGLSDKCVVALGAQDQKCAAFGVGLQDGIMTISLGTAAAITKLWTEAKTEDNHGVGWCGYIQPGTWVTEGVINTAGTCLRWVRDLLFRGEGYDALNREAEQALRRECSLMFYPYMSGPSSPDYYEDAQGSFYGVHLGTQRGDFALSVMEGIAFQIRILLEAMEAKDTVHTIVLFGGGANSPLWCQIIADVTGMRICIPDITEAASAGAAMLAAKAVTQPIAHLSYSNIYMPSERAEMYDEKYKKYRIIEKKLWA